jgi:hypothetical protein
MKGGGPQGYIKLKVGGQEQNNMEKHWPKGAPARRVVTTLTELSLLCYVCTTLVLTETLGLS